MNTPSTQIYTVFTFAVFTVAVLMMAGGIYFLEASFSAKGFYAMASLMLVYASVNVTKAMRDFEESKRLMNKLEDAKAERLLKESGTDYA